MNECTHKLRSVLTKSSIDAGGQAGSGPDLGRKWEKMQGLEWLLET